MADAMSFLMPTLTRVVLAQALDQVAAWHTQGRPLTVAVNLSASSLVDIDLPEEIAAMLADRGVPPCALQLEITEEFLMADRERARDILTRLRHIGIQISIDDFGTGYSSLSYLRDLPIDELKLDRSFVFPMADDARAAALVASIIGLAHSLGLRIVAEGVETHVAYTELTRLGCDQAQATTCPDPSPPPSSTTGSATGLLSISPPISPSRSLPPPSADYAHASVAAQFRNVRTTRSGRIFVDCPQSRKRNLEGNLILQRHRPGPCTQRCVP